MKFRLLTAALVLVACGLGAQTLGVTGKAGGPVVALIAGDSGVIRLSHAGAVVREEAVTGPFTAAVILAGAEDSVAWSGSDAQVLEGGTDPVAVAREALEDEGEGTVLLINAKGAVEVLEAAGEAEYDGESGATAEE